MFCVSQSLNSKPQHVAAQPTASSAAALRVYCGLLIELYWCHLCSSEISLIQIGLCPDCICGEFIVCSPCTCLCQCFNHSTDIRHWQLVIDKGLQALPQRKTDGATIIRSQASDTENARVFKLNAVAGDPVLIERFEMRICYLRMLAKCCLFLRDEGHERQYRFHCPRCTLPIGYQSTPPPAKSGPFVYIFAGALTQMQGQVPQGAFD